VPPGGDPAACQQWSAPRLDEWDESLRYLRLLMAMQAEGAPSWELVKRLLECLRDRHANGAPGVVTYQAQNLVPGGSDSGSSEAQALLKLRSERQAVQQEVEARNRSLSESVQEAKGLQRQCEQLKFRLNLERTARSAESVRMAEHGENLAGELRRGEERLRKAEGDVEELQRRVLEHDGLEPWQRERAEGLRQELSKAHETASQHVARSQEQRARLDAAQEAQRRRAREAAAKTTRPQHEAALLSEASSWEDQRRSIERIRDQVHLAMQQARLTVTAS